MGEEQSLGEAGDRGAVAPRGVRVTLAVGVGVVTSMVGDPLDDCAFQGQRPGHGQGDPQPTYGLERAVGEVSVKADRHAETGHEVGHKGDG